MCTVTSVANGGAAVGGRAPILERERELRTLAETYRAAMSGEGARFVLLAGEAGIGKTAVVDAFCAELPRSVREPARYGAMSWAGMPCWPAVSW